MPHWQIVVQSQSVGAAFYLGSIRWSTNTFGSWMKLCPFLVLGGSSPVQACLRHSIMVCSTRKCIWLDISYCSEVLTGTNRFASSVVAYNERQGLVKLHYHLVVGAEGPDPLDQHLRGMVQNYSICYINDTNTSLSRSGPCRLCTSCQACVRQCGSLHGPSRALSTLWGVPTHSER